MNTYFKCFGFLICAFILPGRAWADLTIFDVRKNLPMSDSDPVYRDFIINGGTEAGLSVGMLLTVQRHIPLYDSYQNRSAGDLQLKVARVKIIHAQRGLAVARLHAEFSREGAPLLEENYIMVGDRIDLASATSGDKKADNGGSDGASTAAASAPANSANGSSAGKMAAQIVVNSVDLSSSKPEKKPSPTPDKVDVPVLQ